MAAIKNHSTATNPDQQSMEWRVFLFITLVLFPVLSVMFVGGWGLLVWISQMLSGPPSY